MRLRVGFGIRSGLPPSEYRGDRRSVAGPAARQDFRLRAIRNQQVTRSSRVAGSSWYREGRPDAARCSGQDAWSSDGRSDVGTGSGQGSSAAPPAARDKTLSRRRRSVGIQVQDRRAELPWDYSDRSASIGLTPVARRAGSAPAANATIRTRTAAPTMTAVS